MEEEIEGTKYSIQNLPLNGWQDPELDNNNNTPCKTNDEGCGKRWRKPWPKPVQGGNETSREDQYKR